MENALRKGAINDPSWESPSIDPAPIDCIYKGKDSVWIITIIKYPVAEFYIKITCHNPHGEDYQYTKKRRRWNEIDHE